MNTLTKLLKSEKTPALRNLITLPLLVQQEPDPDVQVPHYHTVNGSDMRTAVTKFFKIMVKIFIGKTWLAKSFCLFWIAEKNLSGSGT